MSKVITILIYHVLCVLFCEVCSYRILGIFPHPGKSHVDVFTKLMRGLASKGHSVTVISHFPLKEPLENYTDVSLKGTIENLIGSVSVNYITRTKWEMYTVFLPLFKEGEDACEAGFKSENLQELIHSTEHFDVIIAEFFNSDCFLGFVHKFKAPLIGLSSCTIMPYINARFANPSHPAFIPNNFMDYSDNLTFIERVENTVISLINQVFFDLVVSENDNLFIKRYFGINYPPVRDIIFNSSLLLVNAHYSLNLPRPLVPGVIEIGGIHVGEPKPLPENIEKWINESTDGVVYFSLGSVIKGHTFPEDKKQAFLRAFSRLPQRVLWKWENDTMPGKPDNVMIQKWMQQFDILCHPNVKAFISHGGLLGTIEAVHCGVPVIVMPQFGDQFTNARALEANGGGVILHLNEATEEKVYKALKTVLRPEFKKQAEELSRRFRDRPMSPMDTAIYWIEYVARHKGAHFMRTAAVGMPWYQYLLLDVVAFLIAVLAIFVAINYYLIRTVIRYIRNMTKRKQEHKEKNPKKND